MNNKDYKCELCDFKTFNKNEFKCHVLSTIHKPEMHLAFHKIRNNTNFMKIYNQTGNSEKNI
jgi:hypothetical protein